MHAALIRQRFLEFFARAGHTPLRSGPLVLPNDPTLMFANAGMVQFKDVFTGREKRQEKRATTSQKCIRISGKHNDLEQVGVTARHHTFFEMLGNFSFGDYFKAEAIEFAWRFILEELQLPPERLVVTVFGGEGDMPADEEAEKLWRRTAGLPRERIIRCGAEDNFWQMGDTGPCGPCSEIHFFLGDGPVDVGRFGAEPASDGSGWMELWNLVFMQFDRQATGLQALPAPSIDTGAGLERLAAVKQGVRSNYDTDLLRPLVDTAARLAGKRYGGSLAPDDISMRVIADHARATAFLIAEGVFPDRDGRAYVLRRVMRRAIRHGHRLGIDTLFFHTCCAQVVDSMGEAYPELRERSSLIDSVVREEEERFRGTLRRGLDLLADNTTWTRDAQGKRQLPASVAFKLYDTYGFPVDLQEVIGQEQGFDVDVAGFEREMDQARGRSAGSKVGQQALAGVYHQLLAEFGAVDFVGYDTEAGDSRVLALLQEDGRRSQRLQAGEVGWVLTARTPFYGEAGGQVGDRGRIEGEGGALFLVDDTQKPVDGLFLHHGKLERGTLALHDAVQLRVDAVTRQATRRHHSATHLLHHALRTVVGPQAMQKGSRVGPDRLRFDYAASKPLSGEERQRIEALVNEAILANTAVTTEQLPIDTAKARGAIGIFEEKYGETVRMLQIGPSLELCGGTHAARTGDIGSFLLLSDASVAAGVRRIEGVVGQAARAQVQRWQADLEAAAALLRTAPAELRDKLAQLVEQKKKLEAEVQRLHRQQLAGGSSDLLAEARDLGAGKLLAAVVEVSDAKALRELADQMRDRLAPAVVFLAATAEGKVLLSCSVSQALSDRVHAGKLVQLAAAEVGGKGGGRADFAQAGGDQPENLPRAIQKVQSAVPQQLASAAPSY